ncbi:MAG: hypothetical protein ACK502_06145 [Alphaproteobacteria bacterium]
MVGEFQGGKVDGNGSDDDEPKKRRMPKAQPIRLTPQEQALADDLLALTYLQVRVNSGDLQYLGLLDEDYIQQKPKVYQAEATQEGETPTPKLMVGHKTGVSKDDPSGQKDEMNGKLQAVKDAFAKHGVAFEFEIKNTKSREGGDLLIGEGLVDAKQLFTFLDSAPARGLMDKCKDHQSKVEDTDPESIAYAGQKSVPLDKKNRSHIVDLRHMAEQAIKPAIGEATEAAAQRKRDVKQGQGPAV